MIPTQQGDLERVHQSAPGLPPLPEEALYSPEKHQGVAIARDQILVVVKMSTFEWEHRQRGGTIEALEEHYKRQGEAGERVILSHLRQQQVLDDLRCELGKSQIVPSYSLTSDVVTRAGIVIALGGDDHFKQVTHWIDDQRPVVGINSDSQFSEGNLTIATAATLPALIRSIEQGDYRLEPWTRIRLEVDGIDIGPAVGEIALAKADFRLMSRHLLEFNGEQVLHKSSGLLISTGAGSTGWFTSAGLYLSSDDRSFSRTAQEARFELREPHTHFQTTAGNKRPILPPLVEGVLKSGECLKVTSLNNSSGIATRDSLDTVPFERGSVAKIKIDSKPLWVVSADFNRFGAE